MKRIFNFTLSKRRKKIALFCIGAFLLLYLVATIATWALYQHKFFPRSTYSGTNVGNSMFNEQSLKRNLPEKIELSTPKGRLTVSPIDLGLSANSRQSLDNLKKERRLQPLLIFRLIQKHHYQLAANIEDTAYTNFLKNSLGKYEQTPKNAHLVVVTETVKAEAAEAGKRVKYDDFKQRLQNQLTSSTTPMTVPFETYQADIQAASLQPKADSLNKAMGQVIKIQYTGGEYTTTKLEKAGWLSASGNELAFDRAKVADFLTALQIRLGQSWDNNIAVAGQITEKLTGGSGLTVSMHDKPKAVRNYGYCIALKNVGENFRTSFAAKVHSTYSDTRGWGLNGKIDFSEVSSGCDFTVWLAAASDITGFSPGVCDSYYSCTVSPNVIINFDRWQGATDPWNTAGGTLEDYRVMVLNHETGHWLGFGHRNCPGAGQPAPVMQQQSVSLQGCTFSPWPAAYELTALAQLKGV